MRTCYERVLRFLADPPSPEVHDAAFRCLLQFTPVTATQLEPLFGSR